MNRKPDILKDGDCLASCTTDELVKTFKPPRSSIRFIPPKPKPFRPLENPIRDSIRHVLITMGHWCEINGVTSAKKLAGAKKGAKLQGIKRSGFGPGSPDLLVILKKTNTALWLEVKRDEKEKLRPDQERWHRDAKIRGLHVFVVWSVEMAMDIVRKVERA